MRWAEAPAGSPGKVICEAETVAAERGGVSRARSCTVRGLGLEGGRPRGCLVGIKEERWQVKPPATAD